jgi:hypothetical protein
MKTIAKSDHLTLGMWQKDREKHFEWCEGASQGGSAGRLAACRADGASGRGSRMKKTIARNDRMTLDSGKKCLKFTCGDRWSGWRVVWGGLLAAVLALPAMAQGSGAGPVPGKTMASATPTASKPAYLERAPFSAQEFWQKLLPLLDEEDGYRLKERFEETFGMRFPPPSHAHEDPAYRGFWAYPGKDWFFEVGVSVRGVSLTKSKMGLSLGWNFKTFGNAAQGECLALETVRADLYARGWSNGGSDRKYARFDKFVRGKKGDLIIVDGGEPCTTGLSLSVKHD